MNTLRKDDFTEAVIIEEKTHRSEDSDGRMPAEDAVSEVMPSKAESMWNVSLLLTAYLIMGGFLTLKLSADLISYLI